MIEDRPAINVVSKNWGFEKRIVDKGKYRGKFLYLIKSKYTSLHYHKTKDKMLYVHDGKVRLLFFDGNQKSFEQFSAQMGDHLIESLERVTLNTGDNFYVPPGRIHQMFAIEDTQMYEFSNAYGGHDTVILSDGG
jgi:oxalate decarboxylase/phosphoglucose isomerase-like protein (cupin superfamily)